MRSREGVMIHSNPCGSRSIYLLGKIFTGNSHPKYTIVKDIKVKFIKNEKKAKKTAVTMIFAAKSVMQELRESEAYSMSSIDFLVMPRINTSHFYNKT